jgi:hypothetical protein
MSVHQQLDELTTGAARHDLDRGAGPVSTARTPLPGLTGQSRGGGFALDPLAGEDEPWADEDLIRAPDDEDFVRFVRSLWLATLLCLLFWFALALSGFALVTVTA